MVLKILRLDLKKEYEGLRAYVDDLLDNTQLGYRKISRKIEEKYHVYVNHETIRNYFKYREKHLKKPKDVSYNEQTNENTYYIISKPMHKLDDNRASWKDKMILRSLRKRK
jgi:hypothetical protein